MASSPKYQENPYLPSPKTHSPLSSSPNTPQPTVPISRSESINLYATTFVQADSSSFKQVVQLLTGYSETVKLAPSGKPTSTAQPDSNPKNHIPPIKSIPKTCQQQSGFRLCERRSSFKNLKIGPLNQFFAQSASGFSPRKQEIVSPSILDFPSLVLSPVTPLLLDPFERSGAANFDDRVLVGPPILRN